MGREESRENAAIAAILHKPENSFDLYHGYREIFQHFAACAQKDLESFW
jgi:hypothetical protein